MVRHLDTVSASAHRAAPWDYSTLMIRSRLHRICVFIIRSLHRASSGPRGYLPGQTTTVEQSSATLRLIAMAARVCATTLTFYSRAVHD